MESRYILVVDMDYIDESDVVVHCEAHCDVPELTISFSQTCYFAERHSYI